MPSGAWMRRQAVDALGIEPEVVDELLRQWICLDSHSCGPKIRRVSGTRVDTMRSNKSASIRSRKRGTKKAQISSNLFIKLAACAVTKFPQPTGASRADASVTLSYQVSWFEGVIADWETAQRMAGQRCQAWGYSRADAFEGTNTRCERSDVCGNCSLSRVPTSVWAPAGGSSLQTPPRERQRAF